MYLFWISIGITFKKASARAVTLVEVNKSCKQKGRFWCDTTELPAKGESFFLPVSVLFSFCGVSGVLRLEQAVSLRARNMPCGRCGCPVPVDLKPYLAVWLCVVRRDSRIVDCGGSFARAPERGYKFSVSWGDTPTLRGIFVEQCARADLRSVVSGPTQDGKTSPRRIVCHGLTVLAHSQESGQGGSQAPGSNSTNRSYRQTTTLS